MTTKDDLVKLIEEMTEELHSGNGDWENDTLVRYFDAMYAWITSSAVRRERDVSWDFLKRMLIAGKIYE